MNIRETTIKRLEAFNFKVPRDFSEEQIDQAVAVHGIYAAKQLMAARPTAKWFADKIAARERAINS